MSFSGTVEAIAGECVESQMALSHLTRATIRRSNRLELLQALSQSSAHQEIPATMTSPQETAERQSAQLNHRPEQSTVGYTTKKSLQMSIF
jgi:predicted membrane chloride channel (bestrophin family)